MVDILSDQRIMIDGSTFRMAFSLAKKISIAIQYCNAASPLSNFHMYLRKMNEYFAALVSLCFICIWNIFYAKNAGIPITWWHSSTVSTRLRTKRGTGLISRVGAAWVSRTIKLACADNWARYHVCVEISTSSACITYSAFKYLRYCWLMAGLLVCIRN